jgi:hypothetical protein
MKTNELKTLIKEAVREVLKEELAELGKQKINESLSLGLPYHQPKSNPNSEAWPTMNFNSSNINPTFSKETIRQSLMDQMGIVAPSVAAPTTFAEKQNVYSDMLAQVANDLRNNPAEINNFRNIQ